MKAIDLHDKEKYSRCLVEGVDIVEDSSSSSSEQNEESIADVVDGVVVVGVVDEPWSESQHCCKDDEDHPEGNRVALEQTFLPSSCFSLPSRPCLFACGRGCSVGTQ